MLDTQNYTLPPRRQRVWGMAALITGESHVNDLSGDFAGLLSACSSHWHFPPEQLFPEAEKEEPKQGRETTLVEKALEKHAGCQNVYIDCSTSLHRLINAAHVCPCLCPSHPVYCTGLQRYLSEVDFLNLQGFFPSTMPEDCYQDLVQNKTLLQSLMGNSFSSTVCQVVLIAGIAAAPSALHTISSTGSAPSPIEDKDHSHTGQVVLKRISKKRKAPEYGKPLVTFKKARANRKRKPYQRKKPGKDMRKFSKGKKECSTLWDKEQLCFGWTDVL